MKAFTLKRFVLLPLIVLSLILTTGCHLLSHYSQEEVQQYISKNYPNLTYHLESQRNNTWQVTFDKYPQIPIEISEVLHTSAPVVPQVDRILTTNIPLITAFPLMKNYLTAEELSYATYDTSSLYIEIPIPYSAIQNQDVTNFYNRMDQFCKEYAKAYPDFKKEIFIRIIIKPADGSDSPEEYRRVFRLSHY
ncbi:MAG: hypothetical protein E7C34_08140 [Veillonella sp.]|mgnify:FL=1|uniref:hypothetical protein n=1 Tax=Bacillota TaxID=1239 RepID=UPI002904D148|nr:hypothetical protein [Veillonella sp.]MDU2711739.1 hypothetical protein [Veillonella sp.]MDU4713082.1 hypothetical protein [Veillonella sp.]